jgi:hypothetical protein
MRFLFKSSAGRMSAFGNSAILRVPEPSFLIFPFRNTTRLTRAIPGEVNHKLALRFETWAAYKAYSSLKHSGQKSTIESASAISRCAPKAIPGPALEMEHEAEQERTDARLGGPGLRPWAGSATSDYPVFNGLSLIMSSVGIQLLNLC